MPTMNVPIKVLSTLALWLLLSMPAAAAEVRLVELDDAIGPASADFTIRALEDAGEADAELVIIRLNTPGGLDGAMRDLISAILASPVPVATWVAPSGARAASAGTYILYASHFAAMARATNVGSSTPVSIGGGGGPLPVPQTPESGDEEQGSEESAAPAGGGSAMERKVLNDAVAYIEGLAELRDRNAEWARSTVIEAANLTASAALEMNVIEIIADDINDLLAQLNGRQTQIGGSTVTLQLEDAQVTLVEPDWRHRFLSLITNPNIAYILLMLGFYGIVLEFYNPGMGVPGITGIICLLLGAYALQMLPINYVGLALIILGIGLMIFEAMSPSFGVFGIGGAIAFVLGSIVLMDTELEAFRISLGIIGAFAVASAGIFVFSITMLIKARQQKVVTGAESMIGSTAVALEDIQNQGHVRAFGEIWKASTDEPIAKGSEVTITDMDGLLLKVRKRE